MVIYVFGFFIFLLFYIWFGYYFILLILSKFLTKREVASSNEIFQPFVSIIISAYNEAEVIEKRILNLLSLDYPRELLEILIGSDGSTDKTAEIAKRYQDKGVIVFDFRENRGRADIHNDLIRASRGEIIVFTDADTIFEQSFFKNIVRPFFDSRVGAVVGRLSYKNGGGIIAENEGLYWRYELKIKELENHLGLLNNGIGACMAIRKKLFRPLSPVDDVDTATVIDIILAGYKIIYQEKALAFDLPPQKVKSEFKMRIRGTSKTLSSLKHRADLKDWLKNPVLIWTLFSHRLGRYLSPYLMIIVFVSNIFLLSQGILFKIFFIAQLLFYFLVLIGWFGEIKGKRVRGASSCFSFFIAILGMMIGVGRALSGNVKVTYKTDDSL